MTATGSLLWVRAAFLSSVALATGALAHVQSDGLVPAAGVLAALVAVGALACAPFLRRQGSTLRIVTLLVAGQSLVHLALALTAGHRGDPDATRGVAPVAPTAPAVGTRSGSYYDVAYASHTGGHGGGLSVPAPLLHVVTDLTGHPAMAIAHLFAAAVCGWWLASGERALFRLIELAARGWSDLVAPVLLRWAAAARALATVSSDLRVDAVVLVVLDPAPQAAISSRSVSRRGPPRAA